MTDAFGSPALGHRSEPATDAFGSPALHSKFDQDLDVFGAPALGNKTKPAPRGAQPKAKAAQNVDAFGSPALGATLRAEKSPDDDVMSSLAVEPFDLVLKSVRTNQTHRLFNVTFIGRSRSELRPGIDLIVNCEKMSRLHARIEINDWVGDQPKFHSCLYEVRVYDEDSLGGTDVDNVGVNPRKGALVDIGQTLRFGTDELWVLEKLPLPARRAPKPASDTDNWCERNVMQHDVGSLRSMYDWAGLSLFCGDLSNIAAMEVELRDECGEILHRYRRHPNKPKAAAKEVKIFGALAKYGHVFRWLPSTHARLLGEVENFKRSQDDVQKKMYDAVGQLVG